MIETFFQISWVLDTIFIYPQTGEEKIKEYGKFLSYSIQCIK